MIDRAHILAVLYDVMATLTGEVQVAPLLRKILQRIVFHAGFPAGCILLRDGQGTLRVAASIGDALMMGHQGEIVTPGNGSALLPSLPCRQGVYVEALRLPIAELGELILLAKTAVASDPPFSSMLKPVMANLARQIGLCRLNDAYQEELTRQVEERSRLLQESENRFCLLLESMAEGVFGIDLEGRMEFANASCLRMLGYDDSAELSGQVVHTLIHRFHADGSPYPFDECHICGAYRDGVGVHRDDEVLWRRDGSSFPVEYYSIPIRSGGELVGAVVSFVDITERLEKAQKELDMREKMAHVQRLESLGVLAGGIAHDFNNLLTSIMGNVSLAQKHVQPTSDSYDYLHLIEEASLRAADLCRQMLAYSGRGRFVIKPIDLSETVESITNLFNASIPKSITVDYNLAEPLPTLEADISQIQQVVMNLFTNAADAIGECCGTISLSTGVVHVDRGFLSRLYVDDDLEAGDYVYLKVSDTGCGMDETTLQRIFEPFFTTKSTGRGLGMAAVLGIVRSHKGAIDIRSEPGKGTTSTVLLPISEQIPEPQAATGATGGTSTESWTGKGCILVVDDEALVRFSVSKILESLGFRTLLASDGVAGIEMFGRHQDEISLVLMDMSMPGMGGKEAFEEMTRIRHDVKVLLTSGHSEESIMSSFSGRGPAGFIEKPFNTDMLRSVVRRILEE